MFGVNNTPFSTELRSFLAQYIHSIEQLETLCLFAENSTKLWSEHDVFKSIQSSHESVASNLRYFAQSGFLTIESPANYRYSPETPELARLVSELVKSYRERRVAVIDAIYKAPLDPIRNFADAFRIRKDTP